MKQRADDNSYDLLQCFERKTTDCVSNAPSGDMAANKMIQIITNFLEKWLIKSNKANANASGALCKITP